MARGPRFDEGVSPPRGPHLGDHERRGSRRGRAEREPQRAQAAVRTIIPVLLDPGADLRSLDGQLDAGRGARRLVTAQQLVPRCLE
ncbi:MAG: hypothetical protein AAFY88_10705 [Acidobacteriota bacterium]